MVRTVNKAHWTLCICLSLGKLYILSKKKRKVFAFLLRFDNGDEFCKPGKSQLGGLGDARLFNRHLFLKGKVHETHSVLGRQNVMNAFKFIVLFMLFQEILNQ